LNQDSEPPKAGKQPGIIAQLGKRGVLRVAFSYALIAWLLLQIGDVVLEPLGAPDWAMRLLIVLVAAGFPVAMLLAWFFELTPGGVEYDTLSPASARPKVLGLRRFADFIVIALLVGLIAWLLASQFGMITTRSSDSPVIAVLPFNEYGSGEEGLLGKGMADMLIYKLGTISQLIVLAPNSTFEFSSEDDDLELVGQKLGANSILVGTIQKIGNQFRVNARLTDVSSGKQLWSGSYDRYSRDYFALQDDIATSVTEALRVALTPAQESRMHRNETVNLSAYETLLIARHKLETRSNEEIRDAAIYARQAIDIDPGYALAYTTLAEALILDLIYSHGSIVWDEIEAEIYSSLATARSINPQLGEIYMVEARVAQLENDLPDLPPWPEEHIEGLMRRAHQLSPNNADILLRLSSYSETPEERIALAEEAARLDPRSGLTRFVVGELYEEQGDYETALQWFLKSARSVEPYFSFGYAGISRMYLSTAGQLDKAARWARAFRNAHPEDYRAHMDYSSVLIELDAWDQAREAMAQFEVAAENLPEPAHTIWLFKSIDYLRYLGQLNEARSLVALFIEEYLEPNPDWPDFSQISGAELLLTVQALADIQDGQPENALERFRFHFPNWQDFYGEMEAVDLFRPVVIIAALLKMTDEKDRAQEMLRHYLGLLENENRNSKAESRGFTFFTIYAFLGQTDEAIKALQWAMDNNWYIGWSLLRSGSFDPDYAAVLADPRFEVLYEQIEQEVAVMRDSFLENPDIPSQYSFQ